MVRFSISHVRRAAIILNRLMNLSLVTVVPSLVLFGLGAAMGARYPARHHSLMPEWMRTVVRFNPVNWSVEAGRRALQADSDTLSIVVRLSYLAGFALVSGWIATAPFAPINIRLRTPGVIGPSADRQNQRVTLDNVPYYLRQ